MSKIRNIQALLYVAAFSLPLASYAAVVSPYANQPSMNSNLVARDGYQNFNDRSSAFDPENNVNYDYRWEDHNGREDRDLYRNNRYDSYYNGQR